MNGEQIARNIRQIRLNIRNSPGGFLRSLQGRKGKIANQALALITKEPGPPTYPLRWTSERQRRAFFASDGFGGGIPYRRKGGLLKRWKVAVEGSREAQAVTLSNDSPVMQFVQGSSAQSFHKDTGWVQTSQVEELFFREAIPYVIETWTESIDPFKGVQ